MGWIPTWLGGSAEKSSGSANPVSQAPDRASRVKCWEARDKFFECLDKNNIIDSIEEDAKARKQCAPELQGFERECIPSWVEYFKQRRVAEFKKAKLLQEQEATTFSKT